MSQVALQPDSHADDHGHDHDHPEHLGHHWDTPKQQFEAGKLGMWLFLATEVLPGDALDVYLSEDDVSVMTIEDIEEMRRDLGLNVPAPIRFFTWLSGAVIGDFGVTIVDKIPIADIIFHPLLNTLQLGAIITLITMPVAFAIGTIAGYWRGHRADAVISTTAIIGYSIPDFVVGTVLIIILLYGYHCFPRSLPLSMTLTCLNF